jgi:hypothetical protein
MRIVLVAFFFSSVLVSNAFADTLTLTTYYPSPSGDYQALRVAGNLSVGTTATTQVLEVLGRAKFRTNGANTAGFWLTNSGGTETAFFGQLGTSSSDAVGIWHGGAWRFQVDSSGRLGINRTPTTYNLEVGGAVLSTDWFRTSGNGGWYSETWGGGWYMTDGTWIRAYNNKNVYTGGDILANGNISAAGRFNFQQRGCYDLPAGPGSRCAVGYYVAGWGVGMGTLSCCY